MTTAETMSANERANRADWLAHLPSEWLAINAEVVRLRRRLRVLHGTGYAALDEASKTAQDLLNEVTDVLSSAGVVVALDDAANEAHDLAEADTDAAIAREEMAEV